MADTRWERAGLVGAAIGMVAAGAAAGVAIERATVGRSTRRRARLALDATTPYGGLRGAPGTAVAEDGTELYYEIDAVGTDSSDGTDGSAVTASPEPAAPVTGDGLADPAGDTRPAAPAKPAKGTRRAAAPATPPVSPAPEPTAGAEPVEPPAPSRPGPHSVAEPAPDARARAARRTRRRGSAEPMTTPPPRLTVVFCHGYCLSLDSWHFQRAALRGAVRAVYWDQRSHGRSERGHEQALHGPATIDQLGRDLKAVLDAAAPDGPVVLVGHSMGGMTVMAFAAQFPAYVAERVAGVALVSTSAGKLGAVTLGLPAAGARAFRVVAPGLLRALGSQVDLVERTRRATADLFAGLVKRYSFGSREVDPALARFAERLIEATPIDVVAEFYPAFTAHDKLDALAVLGGVPGLVLAGERDLLTPSAHSTEIAERLPDAELMIVPDTGHLVLMERPDVVNSALARLITRAADAVRAPVPARLRTMAGARDA